MAPQPQAMAGQVATAQEATAAFSGLTNAPVQAKKKHVEDNIKLSNTPQPEINNSREFLQAFQEKNDMSNKLPKQRDGFSGQLRDLISAPQYGHAHEYNLRNASKTVNISGLSPKRMTGFFDDMMGQDQSEEEILEIFENLVSGANYAELSGIENRNKWQEREFSKYTPEDVKQMDARFDQGIMQLKPMYLQRLRHLKNTYGAYISQLHPEDFIAKVGPEFFRDRSILQDTEQLLHSGSQYFDFENNAEDREFRDLSNYYNDAGTIIDGYRGAVESGLSQDGGTGLDDYTRDALTYGQYNKGAMEMEGQIDGPRLSEEENEGYLKRIKRRFRKPGRRGNLFGRFSQKAKK